MAQRRSLYKRPNTDRESRLRLLKSLEPQLNALSNFELKVILIRNGQKVRCEDKECLIKDIYTYVPSLEIKKDIDGMSKIRALTESLISLSNIEFNVLLAIYKLKLDNLDKEDQILTIFKTRKLKKLEEDLINFGKIRLLILRLDELNDLEFNVLFSDAENVQSVFENYSIESISHELNSLNQVRIYIREMNQLSTFELDNLLAIKSLECDGVKEDKIKFIFDKYSFNEIRSLLDNCTKLIDIRNQLEVLSTFELNMLLLINGKSLCFSKEKQINKIFKEISLSYLTKDIIRIKNLNQLHNSEFLLVEEGLKKSSFKDLSKFVGNENNSNFNLKSLFDESFKVILDKYEIVSDNEIKKDISDKKPKNQSNLDLFR